MLAIATNIRRSKGGKSLTNRPIPRKKAWIQKYFERLEHIGEK
jgi:hypothetical protein